jgi:hypothetical protein
MGLRLTISETQTPILLDWQQASKSSVWATFGLMNIKAVDLLLHALEDLSKVAPWSSISTLE